MGHFVLVAANTLQYTDWSMQIDPFGLGPSAWNYVFCLLADTGNLCQWAQRPWIQTLLWSVDFKLLIKYAVRRRAVVGTSLPSNPAARVRFPAGQDILNLILRLGVLFCLLSWFSMAVVLTFCWSEIQGSQLLCACLVFWSIAYGSPYRRLTRREFGF